MPDVMSVACPSCGKNMSVPTSIAGKRIKCKACTEVFTVPKPLPAEFQKPAAKAVAKAKPKEAAPEAPAEEPQKPAANAYGYEDDANPYGITADDSDVPRCPHCAKELDPPDTMVCLSCGYDLLERKRHTSKKVYSLTTEDYLWHHLPAAACILAIIVVIAIDTICLLNMRSWFEGSFLEMDEKDENTGKNKFYAPPGMCNLWIVVPSLFIIYKCGRFAIKRLVYQWKPIEKVKK
ncbi:MAG: hypothetical protein ACRCZF_05150 [Gemmataceae bacterium]